jgi:hypothetical protein
MRPKFLALLLSPIGVLLLSAVRLLVVSDYNTTTATTVAASGGYVNTLLGSIAPLVPTLVPFVALLLLLFRQFFLSALAFAVTLFIAPTSLSLPVTRHLAIVDEHRVVTAISQHRAISVVVFLFILLAAWTYHRSLSDAISAVLAVVVVFGIVLTLSHSPGSLPGAIHVANTDEHRLIGWVTGNAPEAALIGFFACISLWIYHQHPGGAITTIVAVLATVALFPYVYNLYPLPHGGGYYEAVIKQPWINAEQFRLRSGRVVYGYALSNQNRWFTILLAKSRKIAYIPASHIISQSVCQVPVDGQPKQYPPLVTLLYSPPPQLPHCADYDSTKVTSVVARGQSLHAISLRIHVSPGRIIAITNEYQHQRLSGALAAYEKSRDWRSAAPAGQRFWYYPPVS